MTSTGKKLKTATSTNTIKTKKEWTTVPNPLLNICVLNNLFEYMDFKDHKTMRLVHSIWNREAVNRIKKRAVVSVGYIRFQDDPEDDDFAYDFTNVPKYNNVMQDFPVEAVRLNLYQEASSPDFSHNFEKTSEIITAFIENLRFNLKFLDLKIFLKTQKDFLRFRRILSAKSVASINHLVLRLYIANDSETLWEDIQISEQLKNVHKLEIFASNKEMFDISELYSVISEKILQFLPNVQAVVFKPYDPSPWFFNDALLRLKTFQSYYFIDQFLQKLKAHAQLKEIGLPLKLGKEILEKDFMKLFNPSLEHISSKEFLGNLTRLEIPFPRLKNTQVIQNLFDRHAPTLQEFAFVVPSVTKPDNYPWRPHRKDIRVPVFPNLRKLSVQHQQRKDALEFGNGYDFIMRFVFSKGNIDYAKDFPKLKELSLGNSEENATKNIWLYYNQFVPSNRFGDLNVFENLKVIKLPPADTNDYYFPSFSKEDKTVLGIMSQLEKCFPNAQNPDLKAASARYSKLRSWSTVTK